MFKNSSKYNNMYAHNTPFPSEPRKGKNPGQILHFDIKSRSQNTLIWCLIECIRSFSSLGSSGESLLEEDLIFPCFSTHSHFRVWGTFQKITCKEPHTHSIYDVRGDALCSWHRHLLLLPRHFLLPSLCLSYYFLHSSFAFPKFFFRRLVLYWIWVVFNDFSCYR